MPDLPAADALRLGAWGRRLYAEQAPEPSRLVLLSEADTLEAAARLVEGDYRALRSWLPSWEWQEGDPRSWHPLTGGSTPKPAEATAQNAPCFPSLGEPCGSCHRCTS